MIFQPRLRHIIHILVMLPPIVVMAIDGGTPVEFILFILGLAAFFYSVNTRKPGPRFLEAGINCLLLAGIGRLATD